MQMSQSSHQQESEVFDFAESINREEMISIVSLDLDEFKNYMSDKYSVEIFNAAFAIL